MSKTVNAICREWLDTLVVSISVAMAFRAYFYEPFNIPTGSMIPTLYGNHSEAVTPGDATAWDRAPLSTLKWLVTGTRFREFRAAAPGTLMLQPTNTGYIRMAVSGAPGKVMEVPTDAFVRGADGMPRLPTGLTHGSRVSAGDLLWCGRVKSGDFLFVNRWIWNFRHPRRGDVMIFSTNGIKGLQQGTHYIKRMTGLPGETLEIDPPRLKVDGEYVDEPQRVGQISRRERFAPDARPYPGYRVSGAYDARYAPRGQQLAQPGDKVRLGADEYYACGDNSPESLDSRYWGPVPGRNLRGLAGGVFWPFTSPRWGGIK